MADTLKSTKWIIRSENTGSQGTLVLNADTTGTYTPAGGAEGNVVWGETWNNGTCALWVVFSEAMQRNCIRIWGIEMTISGGQGVSAYGNASPIDPSNTGYVNDSLIITPAGS